MAETPPLGGLYTPLNISTVSAATQLGGVMTGSVTMEIYTTGTVRGRMTWTNGVLSFSQISDAGYNAQAYLKVSTTNFTCGCVRVRITTNVGTTDLLLENFNSTSQNYYIATEGVFCTDSAMNNRFTNGGQTNCPAVAYYPNETISLTEVTTVEGITTLVKYLLSDTINLPDVVTYQAITTLINYYLYEFINTLDETTLTFIQNLFISIADNILPMDFPAFNIWEDVDYLLTESLTITDAPVYEKILPFLAIIADSLTLGDTPTVSTIAGYIRTLADSLSLSDAQLFSILTSGHWPKNETANLSDAATVEIIQGFKHYQEDQNTISDNVVFQQTPNKNVYIADSLSFSDSLVYFTGINIIIPSGEIIALADTPSIDIFFEKYIPESNNVTIEGAESLFGSEKHEVEFNLNPFGLYELLYIDLFQNSSIMQYIFHQVLKFPAVKKQSGDQEYGINTFIADKEDNYFEPYTDEDVHSFTAMNGIDDGKDIDISLSNISNSFIVDNSNISDGVMVDVIWYGIGFTENVMLVDSLGIETGAGENAHREDSVSINDVLTIETLGAVVVFLYENESISDAVFPETINFGTSSSELKNINDAINIEILPA